jgi:hypothetical protein
MELAFERGPLVYRFEGARGGAWIVHEARARPLDVDPVDALLEAGFDPLRTALLEPGAATPPLSSPPGIGPAPTWTVREPDRLALDVSADGAGILVLSEIWHPYWSARVDGRPAEVLQVDVALRGVPIPAGRHTVELEFRDPHVAYGAWASGIGFALWVGLLAATWRRRGPAVAGSGSGAAAA